MAVDWDLRKLQQSLERKAPGPLYLLYGEEGYLIDEALKALKEKAKEVGALDFNYDNYSAPETSSIQVRDTAEMLPAMCERRFVLYKNVELLKDEAWNSLLPLIENPIDTTTLIFVASKIDKRKKHYKLLQKNAISVDLKKPYENQLPVWVDYIAYLNEIKLSRDASAAILQLVGTNLGEISNEIKKIKSFVGKKSQVEVEDVLNVVSKARIENVFSLTDAIGRRDRAQALLCLANLLENGQNEVGIVSLIHRQLRILASIKQGVKNGLTSGRLSQKVGVPEFFLKQYMTQSRLWDESKINQTMHALHETDKALKSSPISSHIWLENFIVKTC